jgi:hypothetical protein
MIGEPLALPSETESVALVIGKKATLEVPPPGPGLNTVTDAVPAVATKDDGTAAVNCELLTKVVVSALPLKLTVLLGPNPVPFTVSVNPAPPGATLIGERLSVKGTGLVSAKVLVATAPIRATRIAAGTQRPLRLFTANATPVLKTGPTCGKPVVDVRCVRGLLRWFQQRSIAPNVVLRLMINPRSCRSRSPVKGSLPMELPKLGGIQRSLVRESRAALQVLTKVPRIWGILCRLICRS